MFIIEQNYEFPALVALCRAARKTFRPGWRVFRAVIWGIVILGFVSLVLLLLSRQHSNPIPILASLAVMVAFLLLEDRLNAWISRGQMLPGTARATAVFSQEDYVVKTESMESRFRYENILALRESERYFIFFLSKRHGQVYDKLAFLQGEWDDFRAFIQEKTGKPILPLK